MSMSNGVMQEREKKDLDEINLKTRSYISEALGIC